MKITVQASELAPALAHVTSVVEKKATIPILSHVLLDAAAGKLRLRGTDLDIVLEAKISAEVTSGGTAAVSAHRLRDISKSLKGEVLLALDDNMLIVKSGRSRFKLHTLPAKDFPIFDAKKPTHEFVIAGDVLVNLLKRVEFAICADQTRFYLCGVFLEPRKDTLRSVATNGHQLAYVDVPLPKGAAGFKGPDGKPGVILPPKTVREAIKLAKESGIVGVKIAPTVVTLTGEGGTTLISKLIDATYVDYNRVIPVNADKVLQVNRGEFTEAVKRVRHLFEDRKSAVKLDVSAGKLALSARDADHGTAEEEIGANWEADPMSVGFNSGYVLNLLESTEAESVEMFFVDPATAMMMRGDGDASGVFILMPVRV